MKLSLDAIKCFIFGGIALIPLNFFFLNTQVFYLQTLLIAASFVYLIDSSRTSMGRISFSRAGLATLFLIYFAWILLSFAINLIFSFDELAIQGRRLFSIAMTILLLSAFFVGRNLIGDSPKIESVVKGICVIYLFIIGYFVYIFVSQFGTDLYIIRRIIGQRLPFVIAFVSSLAAVYYFGQKKKKMLYFLVMSLGVAVVILSLTRAAYVQIGISFILIFYDTLKRYFFRAVMLAIVVGAITFALLRSFSDVPAVKQITGRVELMFDIEAQSEKDVSGSFRIAMWNFLGDKLIHSPVHLLIGYGQLGPSHITQDLILPDGSSGTSSAHSQYLDLVVREGIIGLLIFLWLVYRTIRAGFIAPNVSDPETKLFLRANSIALVGILFYSIFHETFRYPLFGFYFWLYVGMISRIIENRKNESH